MEAGLSVNDLWMAYFALGGSATAAAVRAYLRAEVDPGLVDFDVLVQAINEKFMDGGGNHPVRYAEEFSR